MDPRLNPLQHEYQERYVAFLDILGFKDLIRRTVGASPDIKVEDIVRALDVPSEVKLNDIILGGIGDITADGHTLTVFSDSVVISTLKNERGLMNLLFHVRAIVFRLLRLRVLSRGGIAQGLAYHHEGKVFGPAMLEAYRLESVEADFPRVILHSEVVHAGRSAAPPVDQLFERMIRASDGGYNMVHSLWALRMLADSEKGFVGEAVDGIARFLGDEETRLASNGPPERGAKSAASLLQKVRWFREYFAWATDRSWIDDIQAPFPK